uniref:Uncharacterized protein n=1 Tax=Timema poppense TaxID=170557 RepID=A0A7R9DII0_TIMPO|nr:unnamed protein product [Timema poppensis]
MYFKCPIICKYGTPRDKKDSSVSQPRITEELTVRSFYVFFLYSLQTTLSSTGQEFLVVVVVFDLSSLMSLSHCSQWLREALVVNHGEPHIFIVGTKRDLMSRTAFSEVEDHAMRIAEEVGAEFWSVSSKTGDGVPDLFCRMAALSFDTSVRREKETENGTITVGSDLVSLKQSTVSRVKPNHKCSGCNK